MRWCTFTVTCVPLIVTVTPLGIGTGCLPIRDSLHSIAGLHDRADCNLGCCGLKAATPPLKLLCIHCIYDMMFRLREQSCSRFPASCVKPVPSDCPICLQGFLTLAFNVSLPFQKGLLPCAFHEQCHRSQTALFTGTMAATAGVPMADTEYVKRMMGDTLAKGCAATIAANPLDPVEYLGQWLLQ